MKQLTRDEVRRRIIEAGIVPVLRAPSADLAIAAARAICAGGIPILEITMTVPGAIDVIRSLTASMPRETLIGAGTVLEAETAQQCFEAGAQFLVSPIFDPETIKLAQSRGKLTMAGALTPNEVVSAWRAGSDFVKIFPCGNVGGANYIKALKSALPQIPMVPTGGVNLATVTQFLDAGASAVGVGGELTSAPAVTETARAFVQAISDWRHRAAA